ncbi:hypothetical protein [Secundilactobacillus silagei]|uniref:hypothetical protein n=1 Tax=Secundilactobacillus silagei TaxID=1293415 RepID=UPI0006D16FB2|nr:hypothetical protein [Secundilactobacillus silagei]
MVGGIIVETPNAVTTTQAQASKKIPYAQYQSDINGIKAALGKASTDVQSNVTGDFPDPNDKDAYMQNGSLIIT